MLGVLAALAAVAAPGASAVEYSDPGFVDQEIVGGLDLPTAVAFDPDGNMYINEKSGRLKVLDKDATTPRVLVDLTSKVSPYGDRGLLGLAVDSDFKNPAHRYIYVSYTHRRTGAQPQDSGPTNSRLSRFPITTGTNGKVAAGPEKVLIGGGSASYDSSACPAPGPTVDCLPSDSGTHSIGTVRSAPDRTLFVGSGDGAEVDGPNSGNAGDPGTLRTYDENSLAGKILHVDPEGKGLPGHSFCPTDTDVTHNCTKLYGKGFRNPFRFTLRPGSNTNLIVGDVGYNTWEELDLFGKGGGNYGWPCFEGAHPTPGSQDVSQCDGQTNTPPAYEYVHRPVSPGGGPSGAIVGGPEYQGGAYPASYKGSIFFGDYALGFLRRLVPDGGGYEAEDFATGFSGVDIEPTPEGDLAYVDIVNGSVMRIKYAQGKVPIASATTSPTKLYGGTTLPFKVTFDGSTSSDPGGGALTYDWDFGDGTAHSNLAKPPQHSYTTETNSDGQAFTATLTVKSSAGLIARKSFTISPKNNPPTPTLTAPASGFKYTDGQQVQLQGSATDPDSGDSATLRWDVHLIHVSHTHFLLSSFDPSPTFDTVRDHDTNSHYEIELTATDERGLSSTVTREIYGKTAPLTLKSSVAGAPLTYAGATVTAPHTLTSVVGYQTSVGAAARFARGGHTYVFQRWSDGGARAHSITVPATASTLTAYYKETASASGGEDPPKKPSSSKAMGPSIKFDAKRGLIHGRRLLFGTAADGDGVKYVEIALGRHVPKSKNRCRWVSRRLGRLVKRPRRCSTPRWIRARLKRQHGETFWRVRFGRALRPGRYRLYVRGADKKGAKVEGLSGEDGDYVLLKVKRRRR